MPLVIDGLVIIVLIISFVIGFKKGFVKTVLPLIALAVAIYLAFTLSSPVANFLQEKFISPALIDTVSEALSKTGESFKSALPDILVNNAGKLGIDLDILQQQFLTGDSSAVQIAENIVNDTIAPLTLKIITSAAMLVMFIVFSLVLNIVARLLNKLIKASLVDGLNSLLGGVMGCVMGLIFSAIFCALIFAIITYSEDGFLFINPASADKSFFYHIFTKLFQL